MLCPSVLFTAVLQIVVSPDWLRACLTEGYRVDESGFSPGGSVTQAPMEGTDEIDEDAAQTFSSNLKRPANKRSIHASLELACSQHTTTSNDRTNSSQHVTRLHKPSKRPVSLSHVQTM